jgi:carbonic anhydrase/acetyltransferase-like protein (isoleucine patch superfamily)
VLAHQVEALGRLGVGQVAVAGDATSAERAYQALRSAGVDPQTVPYVSFGAINGRLPLAPAAKYFSADSPLVLIEPGTLPGADLATVIDRVGQDPRNAVIVTLQTGDEIGSRTRPASAVLGRSALAALADADASAHLTSAGVADALRRQGLEPLEWTPRGSWLKVEHAESLLEANRIHLDLLAAGDPAAFAQRADVQGAVIVAETATIDYATVRGPAIVGPGAFVADSHIGPYTSIGENAVIEGAEMEGCIVCSSAIVRELRSRLQDSVIGSGAVVTQEAQGPRVLRLTVGEDARISLP